MNMTDLKNRLPAWITPQIGVSFANFLAIVFTCGMIYNGTQRDIASNKDEINALKSEMRALRQQDTSIAVLKADTGSIKEALIRIEGRIDRIAPSSMPLPRIQQ